MRRLIAAAVLAVLVTVIYLTGYFYIENTCKETKNLISDCVTAYKENGDIDFHTQKLEEYWSSKEKLLSMFTNHGVIDEIELTIEALSAHGRYPENEMFYECSGKLKILLHQIMEDTTPSMHSIL